MLSQQDKQHIEQTILLNIAELERQLSLAESSSKTVELDQTLAGRVSRIDAIQQQKMAESAVVRERKMLTLLKQALVELSDPLFGVCQECDQAIPLKRLLVKPESKLCVSCQQQLEKNQH